LKKIIVIIVLVLIFNSFISQRTSKFTLQAGSIGEGLQTTKDEENEISGEKVAEDEADEEETDESEADSETGHSPEGLAKSEANQKSILQTGVWSPTDYYEGDILKNSYTVQTGDTLWEISDAVYGVGQDWTKILNLNSNLIGFLEDGTQALILPGMNLLLE
jgi:nucleoid-associated protein YgaU